MHADFLARLEGLRGSEKTVGEVGPTLLDWVSVIKEAESPTFIKEKNLQKKVMDAFTDC